MIGSRLSASARVAGAWLLSATLLAGCAPGLRDATCDLPDVSQAEAGGEIPFAQGVLWRIEHPDASPSYLFGTLHSTDPEIIDLPEPVAARFLEARSLSIEVIQTPRAVRVYRGAIELQDGNLESLIGSERMEAVERAGARYGVPKQRVRVLKPWVLSLLFSRPPAEMRTRRPTLDRMLELSAAERGIPIYGLERMEEQIEAYDGLNTDQQIALLNAALAENWRIDCWWDQVLKPAYLMRDTGTLYALLAPQVVGGDDSLWRSLIVERNARMAERMKARLREGNAFIAVGAAHLPGDVGSLNLLAQQGYEVARIY